MPESKVSSGSEMIWLDHYYHWSGLSIITDGPFVEMKIYTISWKLSSLVIALFAYIIFFQMYLKKVSFTVH